MSLRISSLEREYMSQFDAEIDNGCLRYRDMLLYVNSEQLSLNIALGGVSVSKTVESNHRPPCVVSRSSRIISEK